MQHDVIERTRDALKFIPASDRETWVKIGMAVKAELGDTGFDVWEAWSQQDESFDAKAAKDVWKSIRGNGKVTAGTLFHEAKAHGWRDDGTYTKPTPEQVAERRRIAAERAAKDEAEIARDRAKAVRNEAAIRKAATPATDSNPYLLHKQVSAVATMWEIDAGAAAAILGYVPKSKGEPLAGRLLVAPVKIGDAMSTCELIDGNGRKHAIYGGAKAGGYWAAQSLPDGNGDGLTLLIGEGVATVLSAKEASGHPAIAALTDGNLPKVAEAMRERYRAARIVILADLVKATGAPDPHAIEAALAVNGLLAVPDFGADRPDDATDFNDMAQQHGTAAVSRAIAGATAPAGSDRQPDPDDATIERLAALSPLEYDRIRKAEAEALGVRPGTLDKLVTVARKQDGDGGMDFMDVEPWQHPIKPAALLTEISATVRRFIICQQETADAVALWATMTWFMDVVQVAPLVIITAPEKRCGKSLLLFILGKLAYRPLTASSISPAAMFRAVDAWKPTLLIDEADSFMRDNEELRGIVNAGHTRDSAYVVRTVGEDFTPTRFSVWGAKALAGIGHLADTLMDRAIVLELRRKLPHENVSRLRHAGTGLFDELAEKLARFADDYSESIRKARPNLPASLNDRAQDNWEPLLAIADVAGGAWPDLGRRAALKLSGSDSPTMSTGTELLADIREIFELNRVDRISTADLIAALCADDERPWATFNRGKSISPRQVSKRLAGFDICSNTIRIGLNTAKGFLREQFDEAFSRYLAVSPVPSVTPAQANTGAGPHVTDSETVTATENEKVTPRSSTGAGCDSVTDKKAETGKKSIEADI